jgi:hypothetical protein
VVRHFHQINQSGFKCRHVGINDFCIGDSSLSYLRQFQINDLKIDQSFVCNIATATGDATALSALIGLGNSLMPGVSARHDWVDDSCGSYVRVVVPQTDYSPSVTHRCHDAVADFGIKHHDVFEQSH